MQPPFPSPVATWHNGTYSAISPSRAALSVAGKTIVVTGGGTGIGRETVKAFALAGASHIRILGRTLSTLAETKKIVEGTKGVGAVKISIYSADVSSLESVQKAAGEIGKWDIFVSNAGYLSKRMPISEVDIEDWWLGFEINVKGAAIVGKAFMPNRKPGAAFIGVSTGAVQLPTAAIAGSSSYVASKLAAIKVFEYLGAEYPDVQVLTIHPGVVESAINAKSEVSDLPMDDVKLPAHFILWAASPEAAFANGRFLWCNWDVTELKALEKRFVEDPSFMTTNVLGWPFQSA